MKEYSICITHRNNRETLRAALDSILCQVDDSYEVVVVDGMSDDGSDQILEEYSRRGAIRLVRQSSSRGRGRQIAFEESKGKYILAQMDMDDVFRPVLRDVIHLYLAKGEGCVMAMISREGDWTTNITVAPRELISELGGWRDLQYGEDWDLWSRAAREEKYAWTVFPAVEESRGHPGRASSAGKFRYRLAKYRDELRLGRPVFTRNENVTIAQRIAFLLARVSAALSHSYRNDFNRNFDCADSRYFVDPEKIIQTEAEAT